MRARLAWFLRETVMVIAVNGYALGAAWFCPVLGLRPSESTAAVVAVSVFVGLTLVNAASARVHAPHGRLVNWTLLAIHELLAAAAAASWMIQGRA